MKRALEEEGEEGTPRPSKKSSLSRIQSLTWTRSDGALMCSGVSLVPQNRRELKHVWRNCPYFLPRCYVTGQGKAVYELDEQWNHIYFCTNSRRSLTPFHIPDNAGSLAGFSVRTDPCVSAVLLDPVTYKPFFFASTLDYGVSVINSRYGYDIGEVYDKREYTLPKEARLSSEIPFQLGHISVDVNMGKYYFYAERDPIVIVVDHTGNIERILKFPTNYGVAFLGGNSRGDKLAVVCKVSMLLEIYDNRYGIRTPFTFDNDRPIDCVQVVHKDDIIVVQLNCYSKRIVFCDFEQNCLALFDLPMACREFFMEPGSTICHMICNESKWHCMDVKATDPRTTIREIKPHVVGPVSRIKSPVFYPPNFQWIPWAGPRTKYPTEWDKKQTMKFLRCGLLGRKKGCIPPSDSPNLLRLLPLDAFYVLTEFLLNELQFQ